MCNDTRSSLLPKQVVPEGGLEPPIFGLGDRRLIHWATRALLTTSAEKTNLCPVWLKLVWHPQG